MAARRLIDVDITDRADGKVPVWDDGSSTHVYVDQSAAALPDLARTSTVASATFPATPSKADIATLALGSGTWDLFASVEWSFDSGQAPAHFYLEVRSAANAVLVGPYSQIMTVNQTWHHTTSIQCHQVTGGQTIKLSAYGDGTGDVHRLGLWAIRTA